MRWGLTRPRVARQARRCIMSDTLFTAAPHWRWLIVLYFFIGGIAGGSFFLAALLDLFGRPQDRPIVRTGYYVAFLRSEEHTSELQSLTNLVCRLLLEKKNTSAHTH